MWHTTNDSDITASQVYSDLQLVIQISRGCLVPLLFQNILGFGPSFCIMELNIMQIFWQKGGYSPFWILASRGQKKPKRVSRGPHEGNKFCILDGTKHNPENFGILHSIIPK
jgi:hypothetical protein